MRLPEALRLRLLEATNAVANSRRPDFVIGDDYLRRWWWIRRNKWANAYIHHMLHDDEDRALHDHPWLNCSIVLDIGYFEHTPAGVIERRPGDVCFRRSTALHRLRMRRDANGFIIPAKTLFLTGPRIREWGFACPKGWVPWQQFCDTRDYGKVGRGCGEHS